MRTTLTSFAALLLVLVACKPKPKQVEYAENIEKQIASIHDLIASNSNTIDSKNVQQLKEAWMLMTDNVIAYEKTNKATPCNEPECVTAYRQGNDHVSQLKDFIKQAKKDPSVDLNQLFPIPDMP